MLFGLVYIPNFFQNFINNILEKDILDFFVTTYVNNILVFSKTFQKYKKHVRTVLARLQATGLQLDINKYKFEVYKTKYLSLIIQFASPDSCPGCVKMCPAKIGTTDSWERLQSVKDI